MIDPVVLAEMQEAKIKSIQEEAKQNIDQLFFVKSCFRLLDSAGIPQTNRIDTETAQGVMKAKQEHVPVEKLHGDVYCLVRGFSSLQYDSDSDETKAIPLRSKTVLHE